MTECFLEGRVPEGRLRSDGRPRGTCEGVHQWHHIIKQQVLRREIKDHLALLVALTDRRNLMRLCDKHHQWVTGARIHFTRDELPASVEEFASEFGLEWALDRYYGQRAEAA